MDTLFQVEYMFLCALKMSSKEEEEEEEEEEVKNKNMLLGAASYNLLASDGVKVKPGGVGVGVGVGGGGVLHISYMGVVLKLF